MILLDTHVVAWAHAGEIDRFPPAVARRLDAEPLAVSPITVLELEYLYEVGRTTERAATVMDALRARLELTVADASVEALCAAALELSWTRDPFDRLLAAHATIGGLPLVTKDETLLTHLSGAWWG